MRLCWLIGLVAVPGIGLGSQMLHGLAPRTFCLTFHDIIPERTGSSLWFDCSVTEFTSELDWLARRGAHFISVNDLYDHLTQGKKLPSHPVCITFADNYLGFYTYAYPELKARHIPCTMFVHTGYVGSPVGRPKMNWYQLLQLDREHLCTIESQTVSHPADLRLMPNDAIRKEMRASKQSLEHHLGHAISDIAYPNGKFDPRSEVEASKAGYRIGFSEVLTPAEKSPSIYAVARYVHTKFKRAWADANP